MENNSNALLLEIAAEVCYKMGGIHTVLVSKIPEIQKKWEGDYVLVGPLLPIDYSNVFEIIHNPEEYKCIGKAVRLLKDEGLEVFLGRWNVPGKPLVVLLNPYQDLEILQEIKKDFLQFYNIEIPLKKTGVDKFLVFGYLVERLLSALDNQPDRPSNIVAHFHEFNASSGILEVERKNLNVATIFTTHATVLGRHLATFDDSFYQNIERYDREKEVEKLGENSHSLQFFAKLEHLLAHSATVFTTVSEVTSRECKFLLGKEPDLITPNGLDIPTLYSDQQEDGLKARAEVDKLIKKHFYRKSDFNFKRPLLLFTSGRYEFKNKGYDLIISALSRVNQLLKKEKSPVDIVMFFIVETPVPDSPALNTGIESFKNFLKDCFNFLSIKKKSPVLTHKKLFIEKTNKILVSLQELGLTNSPQDRVKILYHPDFITPKGKVLDMEYYHFVKSCNLGIFPSNYEPWGFTPVECLSLGIPAIASDQSGFGKYVLNDPILSANKNIYVLKRSQDDFAKSSDELTKTIMDFIHKGTLNTSQNITTDINFRWNRFISNYLKGYEMAIEKISIAQNN